MVNMSKNSIITIIRTKLYIINACTNIYTMIIYQHRLSNTKATLVLLYSSCFIWSLIC